MIPCLCFNYFFVLLSIFRKRFWCSWKHLSGSAILFSWMIPYAKWESLSRVDGEKMHSNGNWKLLHTRSRWHAMTSEIRFVPLPSGDATSGHQTTLKELNLWSCIGLSSMEGLCDLVSLTKLYVIDCSDLLQLHDMDDFCSLRFLKIDQCRQLRSLPWSGLLVSLETFILFGCHQAPRLGQEAGKRSGRPMAFITIQQNCADSGQKIRMWSIVSSCWSQSTHLAGWGRQASRPQSIRCPATTMSHKPHEVSAAVRRFVPPDQVHWEFFSSNEWTLPDTPIEPCNILWLSKSKLTYLADWRSGSWLRRQTISAGIPRICPLNP